MKILIINSGSSSVKYQLIKMPEKKVLARGLIGRIGIDGGYINQYIKEKSWQELKSPFQVRDHREALEKIYDLLSDPLLGGGVIKELSEISAIGHRVVHGGNTLTATVEITKEVKDEIRAVFPLAPLHNPANLMGIEVAQEVFPRAREFAVFDTAFHHSISQRVHRYALPEVFYKEQHVRVYGFHGISHQYVSRMALSHLQNPQAKIITLHLGNGASMAAIKNGVSVDTSMGFGPNSGLIMGTRSGDLDPTVLFYLLGKGYKIENLSEILNKESGMLALSGKSDMRDISQAYENKDPKARLSYEMYAYRIKKYIGAYTAIMNGLDAIVFTGGVGENDTLVRAMICADMEFTGLILDKSKNETQEQGLRELQTSESRAKILTLPTDEEMEIAREVSTFL
ncbi:acetate/propionate family kinase [Bacteroidetes bacterium endosymbiont of Geopemphigus sp.]|uniref:acetate/propionate family kinase n=1 Tax=Bacteroidetes bacterium endosymbiont of Geopemphigus sp. TaxID=2047937 RepID=UPI000CD2A6DE|nr:acetate kinase [Bacteroidetes bacterium endosymbiont of Geopemphigus sp.]